MNEVIIVSQPPKCCPLIKTLGTVDWPLISATVFWIAAPFATKEEGSFRLN